MAHSHPPHTHATEHEHKTLLVIVLTLATMGAEVVYGYATHSMALLADGYHMGTHALALGLTYVAYLLARVWAHKQNFPYGTDKIGTLAAYTSALFLGATGIWIIWAAIARFFHPLQIAFNEALLVAVIGLVVNAVCLWIMEPPTGKHPRSGKRDYNFLAAYYHILADALTSLMAIGALLVGKFFNIVCFDPIIGILGGILILRWSVHLLKDTVISLIDMKK